MTILTIGIGGDRTGTFRGEGVFDFAPDFVSKLGLFLGHFGQRQRVSGDLGASNTRFKTINRPKINSTLPPGAIFGPWGPRPQIRGQKPENVGSRPVPRGQKWHLGYRRVDFWAIYGL